MQLEAASSDSSRSSGFAERARLSGTLNNVSYDFGVLHGGTDFAGMARGTTSEDGMMTARFGKQLTVTGSASTRASDFSTPLSGIPAQHFSMANIGASYGGLAQLEYGWLSRRDDGRVSAFDGTQHGLRATSSLPLGPASLSVSYERGTVNADIETAGRPYSVVTLSAQTKLGDVGDISVFGAHNDGNTLTGSMSGVANAGVSMQFRLPWHSSWRSMQSAAARRSACSTDPAPGSASRTPASTIASWAGSRSRFANASGRTRRWRVRPTRARSISSSARRSGSRSDRREHWAVPKGGSPMPRRANRSWARWCESATRRRSRTRMAVWRSAASRLHASACRSTRRARRPGALLVGDAFVDTREKSTRPVLFALSVARGGSVRALVRILGPALGTLAENADSMVTVGMEPNVLVALESGRDTIYQSSDERGRLDFGSVAPGTWTLVVMPSDIPDHHVFETDRIEVTVKSGERSDVEFKLVPQRRTVTFIGHDDIALKAKPLPK